MPPRTTPRLIALLSLVAATGGVWLWSRSAPWAKAERRTRAGEPGEAVEILSTALAEKTWSPAREEALLEKLAQAYMNIGAIANAEKTCRTIKSKFPKNALAHFRLGHIHYLRDHLAFAAEELESALALSPNDFNTHLLLANVYLEQDNHVPAARVIAAGLLRFPGQASLLEKSGDLAYAQGLYQEALASYDQVLRQSPEDRRTTYKVIYALLGSGNWKAAQDLLEKIRRKPTDRDADSVLTAFLHMQCRFTEVESLSLRIYRSDQNDLLAGSILAIQLARRGDFHRSEEVLRDVENRLPGPSAGRDDLIQRGESLNSLDSAYRRRKYIREIRSTYENARYFLSLRRGHIDEAALHIRRALDINPRDFTIIYTMSDLARKQGNTKERFKWLNELVRIYHSHPLAILYRGWAFLDQGNTSDAVVDAKTVADIYPHMSEAQALLSRVNLMIGKKEAANTIAERAVDLNPRDQTAQLALALARESLEDATGAETAFIAALELDPLFAQAHMAFARFLQKSGRHREAAFQRDTAAQLEPGLYRHERL